MGASDISFDDKIGFLFSTKDGMQYVLDTTNCPLVRLVTQYQLEDFLELDKAKEAAMRFNQTIIGLHMSILEDKSILLSCPSFMITCNTMRNTLPFMAAYMDESRLAFIKIYHEMPIKAD